jgi:hypothetical protein
MSNQLFLLAEQRILLEDIRALPIKWSDPNGNEIVNDTIANIDDKLVSEFGLAWDAMPNDAGSSEKGVYWGRYLQSVSITCYESIGMDGKPFIYCRYRDPSAPLRTVRQVATWLRRNAWGIKSKEGE